MIDPYYKSLDKNLYLLHGDTMELLPQFDHQFDMVFADPPYFLSNNGLSIQSGKIVSVNKGAWDKSHGFDYVNDFNRKWLSLVREKMKDDATIWISGTMHNIFSVGQILTELGFKILNVITWEKTNPPPNFSCRFFTHSSEQIIWARKHEKVPHYFNYDLMKELNDDKQMKDVWKLPAIAPWEKSCGKHPTQKPLSVLTRLILASTKPNAWILDPFSGSSTTGIAANLANRRFLGIDQETEFLEISIKRKQEIENEKTAELYRQKIAGFITKEQFSTFVHQEISDTGIKVALGFCRSDNVKKSKSSTVFYFHAIEGNNKVKEFPIGILEAQKLILYSGGRGRPNQFTGLMADIQSVELKHKSDIKGKENSETEFYYEVTLKDSFEESETLKGVINLSVLFEKIDEKNRKLFQQYLPALATWENVLKSITAVGVA
ncbi:site-specific DNA-methyltransferase [Runella sp.]|jgi:site-specific DNA-methyltransferase (adenine-specific)|uniref:DNA-methyltransferase n=1 Tax=Runella sp. TaxID=1960881 RepID=UPI002613BB8C|nr:site-specific DNA-methyltransferase [Runella sp.]